MPPDLTPYPTRSPLAPYLTQCPYSLPRPPPPPRIMLPLIMLMNLCASTCDALATECSCSFEPHAPPPQVLMPPLSLCPPSPDLTPRC